MLDTSTESVPGAAVASRIEAESAEQWPTQERSQHETDQEGHSHAASCRQAQSSEAMPLKDQHKHHTQRSRLELVTSTLAFKVCSHEDLKDGEGLVESWTRANSATPFHAHL